MPDDGCYPDPTSSELHAYLKALGKLLCAVMKTRSPFEEDRDYLRSVRVLAAVWCLPSSAAYTRQSHGIKCMIEKFPFEKANEALQHMSSGKVRFRGVLVT
jgi:hypothetical protein